MNVDENGSVAHVFVQKNGFFKRQGEDDNKGGWTIFKRHHSDKSHDMASIRIGFIKFASAHDLNNWTRLCWGESMWPEHQKLVLSSWWMRHCSTSWCRSNGQMPWPFRIWDVHLRVFQWILLLTERSSNKSSFIDGFSGELSTKTSDTPPTALGVDTGSSCSNEIRSTD